jgi:hypothetical protein
MRGFLRRHSARLLAKRGGAGRAELEVLQHAQVWLGLWLGLGLGLGSGQGQGQGQGQG